MAAQPADAADPKQDLLEAAQAVRLGEVPATGGKAIDVRAAAAGPQITPPEVPDPGRKTAAPQQAGTEPQRPAKRSTSQPSVTPVDPNGPNVSKDGLVRPLAAPPNIPLLNTDGTTQAEAGGQRPDPNAAVGTTQIVETTNLFLRVRNKSFGSVECQVALNTFLGTGDSLTDPRVQFDTLNDRFSLVVTIRPASPSATPALWVAASTGPDACGGWFGYRISFPMIIQGLQLDFPILGQDRNALIITSNNVNPASGSVVNASAIALSKFGVYTGTLPAFTLFGVNENTSPALVAGAPMLATSETYLLSGVPGVGYLIYRAANTGTPFTSIELISFVDAPYGPPKSEVGQCAPLTLKLTTEGIDAPVVQTEEFIWFTHTARVDGLQTVMYGAVRIADGALFRNTAFHSFSSEDFNPSIGVGIFGPNLFFVYLNWAYVDLASAPCLNASPTVSAALPGEGVPALWGTDGTLVNGGPSPFAAVFGDYSSVSIDPSPPGGCFAGSGAVTSQQYYAPDGQWRTRLGQFCFA